MMKPLTQIEHNVLSGVPASNRAAMKHTPRVKWEIDNRFGHGMTAIDVVWHNLKEAGFITEYGGYCKRTTEGDRALDPVGAVEHAQTVVQG